TISNIAVKEQAKYNQIMMLKNRKGDITQNIEYALPDGTKADLYSLNKKYTILYFYNPDCHACKEIIAYMKSSLLINKLLASGMLDILALYTDEDLSLWYKYIPQIPPTWKNAYDKKVKKEQLYDLRAIPCLYLLDIKKKVLLKDADVNFIEIFLQDSLGNIEKEMIDDISPGRL
ncbi:thioredoxin family protein, partial [Dysgonomonas sp. Marseille-P4677]|uniref:thioredoxin family protein n=1 Tax=Dysgonomonas sp. Marseille-P4677 TaxID=2364790 RepID=UPI001913385E